MTTLKMASIALVVLMASLELSSGQNQNSNNWFTKSMDYFHYEECSFQEKSDLTAKFYNCLNSKPDSSKDDYSKYFESYKGYMGGMSGGSLNPQIPDYMNKYNPQNKFSSSNGSQGDKKKVDKDSWAFKTCDELQEILRCVPVLEETKCLTESEHKFFSTMKYFFQVQSGYICSNKERISEAFEKSTCKSMKNRQDIQQQCFSINAQRLSYDFKVNFEDGVMCDLLINLKTCEESYYEACEEEIRAQARHGWILALQVTPCNSTLFEPLIDALSSSKRSKRSVFNNQYGFKTADGNGNGYYKESMPYNQDQADDQVDIQKSNDLAAMFAGIMEKMQKSGASAVRQKRSISDFMGGFTPFGKKSSKSEDSESDHMGFVDGNMNINQDWASKFNSFEGDKSSNEKSKPNKMDSKVDTEKNDSEVVLKGEKKDDKMTNGMFGDLPGMKWDKGVNDKFNPNPFSKSDSDKPNSSTDDKKNESKDDVLNPMEKNKKMNFDFANKFSPFGRRKRSLFADSPGMKWDKGVNDKFNPNPFSKSDSDKPNSSTDDKTNESVSQAETQKNINQKFAEKFGPFGGVVKVDDESISRTKRSADPYDESNPDEIDSDDQSEGVTNKSTKDDSESTNEKQKEFSKKMNKKFSDFFKNKLLGDKENKTADDADDKEDDDSDKSPFGDLSKFVKERIKEQKKKELKKEAEKKKDDDSSMTLKSSKPEADKEDDKEADKDDPKKKLQKFIKDQIKKEMDKEKEKKKDKKDEKKLTEREKDELERKKEREQDEKEREKQRKEYEKEREQDELERKKEREQNEKERQKQKEEYEREHGKKSTTPAPPMTTTLSPSTSETTTLVAESTSEQSTTVVSEQTEQSTNAPSSDEKSTDASTTVDQSTNPPATELSDTDGSKTTADTKSDESVTQASDNPDPSTTLKNDSEIA